MRIGINALFLIPGEVGGSEAHLRGLLQAMARDAAHTLVVFTNRENHDSFADYDRVPVGVAAASRMRRVWAEQRALPALVQANRIDVLYSPGYTAPLKLNIPQVVGILDTQFIDHPGDFSWLSRTAQRFLVGRAARTANVITTLSAFSRDRIVRHLSVPKESIVITYSGVDGRFAIPAASPVEPPYLLYIARTYPHKNAARLVQAFDRLSDRIPHTLVICGKPDRGEPPAHPRVRRIHALPERELVGLLQHADCLVHASEYEGFGRPLIEAQEAGARVIAANAAAIPEIAGDGATYFDFRDPDAIAQAIHDALQESPERRAQLLQAGRQNTQRFQWPNIAQQTLQAIQQAQAGRNQR